MDEPVDALRQSSKKPETTDAAGVTETSKATKEANSTKAPDTASASGAASKSASSSKPPQPPQPPKPTKPAAGANGGGLRTGLTLILVLVVLGLALGVWWQKQRLDTVTLEVATRLQQSERQLTQVTSQAKEAVGLVDRQREVLDQLTRELAVNQQELRTLQQAWEAANEGLDQTLLLNDLSRLVMLANQELTLFGNVNSAISILSSVQPMLQAQSSPALKALQQAIITDLSRLRTAPQVDVTNLAAHLDSLIELTGKAPLLAPAGQITSLEPMAPRTAPAPERPQPAGADDDSWWGGAKDKVTQWSYDAWAVLSREFNDVMSIRRADDPQALLLSEEQAIQLRSNMRAMLLSAQLALMTRQSEIWRSELTQVQSLLKSRFDTQALDTKAALNLLSELLSAPVTVQTPSINDTLSALASAQRVVTIPVAPDDGGGEDQVPPDDATESPDDSTKGT